MTTALPIPKTKRLTAVCANCDEVLYKNPYDYWRHDDTNDTVCPPTEEPS